MLPYRDENPTLRTPVVTIALIAVTTLVWLSIQGAGAPTAVARSICQLGVIPGELLGRVQPGRMVPVGAGLACELGSGGGVGWLSVLSSMFLHGSWFHILGNMWFFWIFGNNVEDSMGRPRFLGFYLLCGVVAALAQIAVQPNSAVPMVGASGAISGVMGAYLVLYPRVRVHMLVFLGFFITTIAVPAWLMLFYWLFIQALSSIPMLAGPGDAGGVAFMAHVGGFVAGAALIKLFAQPQLVQAHRVPRVVVREYM